MLNFRDISASRHLSKGLSTFWSIPRFCSALIIKDFEVQTKHVGPSLSGPDYMSRAGPVCRDVGTPVKRNKNQLCDYMTTGPAWLAEIPASRCNEQRFLTSLLSLALRVNTRSKLFQPYPTLLLRFLMDSRTITHSLQSIFFSEYTL